MFVIASFIAQSVVYKSKTEIAMLNAKNEEECIKKLSFENNKNYFSKTAHFKQRIIKILQFEVL